MEQKKINELKKLMGFGFLIIDSIRKDDELLSNIFTKKLSFNILTPIIAQRACAYELTFLDEKIIENVLMSNMTVESLDRIISQDGKDLELYNKFGYCDSGIENYPLTAELEKLSKIDRKIIESRYFENLSQSETGANLGMYQVEVSRREKKILTRLKDNIAA